MQQNEDPINDSRYRLFITHGSADKFLVERFLKPEIERSGATVFVDTAEIEYGDDFRVKITQALQSCHELVAFLTPTSIQRPWVHAELGACIVRPKVRVVAINYFIEESELQKLGILSILGTRKILLLDDFDKYLSELTERVRRSTS